MTVAQVFTTIDASAQLGRVAGLRALVEEHLLGILESAVEIKKLQAEWSADVHAPLLTRVDAFEILYSLDVNSASATVLAVVVLESRPSEQRGESATSACVVLPFVRPGWPVSAASDESDPSPSGSHSPLAG